MAQNGQAGRTEYRHDTSRRVPDKGEGTNTGMKREKGDTGDIRYMPFPVRLFAPSPGNGTGDGNGALSGKHRDGKRGGLVRFIAGNPPAGGSPAGEDCRVGGTGDGYPVFCGAVAGWAERGVSATAERVTGFVLPASA